MVRKAFRLDDDVSAAVEKLAAEDNTTETAVVTAAVKLYRDYRYLGDTASFIPQEIENTFAAQIRLLEKRLNVRSNKLLSELAIQQCVLCKVIAENLEVNPLALENYRRLAVEYLQEEQRIFRLEEAFDA